MRAFGLDELEVPDTTADPAMLRRFLFDVAYYVLSGPVRLRAGETIGFSAQQRVGDHPKSRDRTGRYDLED